MNAWLATFSIRLLESKFNIIWRIVSLAGETERERQEVVSYNRKYVPL